MLKEMLKPFVLQHLFASLQLRHNKQEISISIILKLGMKSDKLFLNVSVINVLLERFSVECLKTNTRGITSTDHSR